MNAKLESSRSDRLAALDHAHVWHPFTPMQQWREQPPLIIDHAEGSFLVDTEGRRYIDGVSSLWCNVHGHRVPAIDHAIREQLDRVAHTTLLGLASPPSIELAARLASITPGGLDKVFYSDAGATALEVAFKMAVGYWHHTGRPEKKRFIGLEGAYHGDTTGSMSVGYTELMHRPFLSMIFDVDVFPAPDCCRLPPEVAAAWEARAPSEAARGSDRMRWPSEDPLRCSMLADYCLDELERLLASTADQTAAVVIEPMMQGAAGMVRQPDGFVRRVAELARRHDVLLIADEVATGFARTGAMFACDLDGVEPDILCLAKGLTGGYLPLAATVCTERVERAFRGPLEDRRTLYHGHTYTGNPLACAAALASLDLIEAHGLVEHVRRSEVILQESLDPLRACPRVRDVRRRGVMVGIELCEDRDAPEPLSYAAPRGKRVCDALRDEGVIVRPLGNVVILMPAPGMAHDLVRELADRVTSAILRLD